MGRPSADALVSRLPHLLSTLIGTCKGYRELCSSLGTQEMIEFQLTALGRRCEGFGVSAPARSSRPRGCLRISSFCAFASLGDFRTRPTGVV